MNAAVPSGSYLGDADVTGAPCPRVPRPRSEARSTRGAPRGERSRPMVDTEAKQTWRRSPVLAAAPWPATTSRTRPPPRSISGNTRFRTEAEHDHNAHHHRLADRRADARRRGGQAERSVLPRALDPARPRG